MVNKQLIKLDPIKEQVRTKLLEKYDSTVFLNTDTIDLKLSIKELLNEYIAERNIVEPTIYITTNAYVKMRKLVDATTTEIGWYGTVEQAQGIPGAYIITDIIVYPQTVSGATCTQDDDKMFEFEMSLTDEQVNHRRFHGHSHVNMGVTPSGVDEQFYSDILTQCNDYYIVLITNKKNEYTIRFYDVANNILYSNLNLNVMTEDGLQINDWYDNVQDLLTTYKPATYNYGYKKQTKKEDKEYKPYEYNDDYIFEDSDRWDAYYNRVYGSDFWKGRDDK